MSALPRPGLGFSSSATDMSTAGRSGNLQHMLDMEAQQKLVKLGLGRAGKSTPNLPTLTTTERDPAPSLQARRCDSLTRTTDDSDQMLRSFRRSITAPSLSINIPPPRDGALGDGTGGGGDDCSASEQSSICHSPSWEDYGRKKNRKKKKNRMAMDASSLLSKRKSKVEKEAGARPPAKLTKAGGHRQSMQQTPALPVPPIPLTGPWSGSPGSGSIMKTTDLQVGSVPALGPSGGFGNHSSAPTGEDGAPLVPVPASMPVSGGWRISGFVGGIRLEKEKQAAARAALASHSWTPSHTRNASLSVFPSVRSVSPKQREQAVVPGPRLGPSGPPAAAAQTLPALVPVPVQPRMLQHRSTQSSNAIVPSHAGEQPGHHNAGAHGRSQSLLSATASKLFQKQRPSGAGQSPSVPNGGELPQPHPQPALWSGQQETCGVPQQAAQLGVANTHQGYFSPEIPSADFTASPNSMTAPTQQSQRITLYQPPPGAVSPGYVQQGPVRNHEYLALPPAAPLNAHPPSAPGRSPQFSTVNPARDATRDTSEASSATGPTRSFRDKAKAMLNRTSLLPPAHPAQDRSANPLMPTITGPFNPRGTGPHFQATAEEYSSDSSPSPYGPQTSGGSSISSLDDVSSPATTPDTSRPQSSKDTSAVVGDDPVVPHDTCAFRTSQSAVIVMGAKPTAVRPVRPRRSSSSYSQQGAQGSPHGGKSYWAEPTSGELTGPASVPAPREVEANGFVVDFDADSPIASGSLLSPPNTPAGPQQQRRRAGPTPAPARDEVGEAATWQSITALGEPEASDSSGQGSHEESDDSGRVSTSFLPPLKHEPFIPPKSRVRKNRMPPRAGSSSSSSSSSSNSNGRGGGSQTDNTGVAAVAAVVVEQQQQQQQPSSGAAYLKEARRSIHAPSPTLKPVSARMSIGPPPAVPREALLRTQTFPPPPPGVVAVGNRKSLHPSQQQQQAQATPLPQEQKQHLVTVSRRSLIPPSPTPSPSRPASGLRTPLLKDGGGGSGLAVGQQMAKMLVVCCGCDFFQDMPSCVYECMANPDAVVEDRAIGVSGAITTSVKCCWCGHNMSTSCCSGFAAIVHLTQKLH